MPFTTIRPFDALADKSVYVLITMTAVRATLALTVVALLQPRASAGRPLPPWSYVRTSGKLPGIAWFGANETGFEVSHTDSASLHCCSTLHCSAAQLGLGSGRSSAHNSC
jgi:hypothetical protein